MKKKVKIIGAGISGLSAACLLGKEGFDVEVFEKNSQIGGRARQFKKEGFTFDMGPTFYWMPDIIEKFFNYFGKTTSDFYDLKRLNPGYRIYYGYHDYVQTDSNICDVYDLFEKLEPGSSDFLKKFIADAENNYNIGVKDIIYRPGKSPLELVTPQTTFKVYKFLKSISYDIRKNIKNKKLRQWLEFPVIFLGAKPTDIPAFYNFMNFADIKLGTWHPIGGMYKIIESLETIAKSYNVKINVNAQAEKILTNSKNANGIVVNGEKIDADIVLSGADYQHTELLLKKELRTYPQKYWQKKVFAPSAVLYYVGFNKKIEHLVHHSLFFDTDFDTHINDIYKSPKWTKDPLFYTSFPSISDATIAPKNKEAGIFLIPIAPGLDENKEAVEKYFDIIISRIEKNTDQNIRDFIVFKETYSISNFVKDYNSYKGNAYGLANILLQTAFLRPKIKSKKVSNLFFTGQLTVPGPGVPPSFISGEIAANEIKKFSEK